ncbi:MAG: CoA-binding protein [Actinomycetota bacterium]|nr:CoA-binding protein [Actinomycetota bacterium]
MLIMSVVGTPFVLEVRQVLELNMREIDSVAVVGASRDPEKYGYKVLMDLKNGGYKAFAINPGCVEGDEIEGVPCYPDLLSIPNVPDLLITVVPPKVTEKIVRQAKELGIEKIWMQPGSESEYAISFSEENGIGVMHNACIMIFRKEGVLKKGHRP